MAIRRRPFRPRRHGSGRGLRQPVVPPMVRRALGHAQRAMQEGVPDKAARAFRQRVEALLEAHGYSWDELADASVGDPRPQGGKLRGRLPAQCPSCTAPLRSDEVEWVEDDRATCTYCGSIVLAS